MNSLSEGNVGSKSIDYVRDGALRPPSSRQSSAMAIGAANSRAANEQKSLEKAPFIIALDGPAASGKGTLGVKLAHHYGLNYLETGLCYRAVAYSLKQENLPFDNEEIAVEVAQRVNLSMLSKNDLSSHEIGELASQIAVFPRLRANLVAQQRAFSQSGCGAVLDGRDIGTVVCPQAQAKIFIYADVEIRAKRRYKEVLQRKGSADFQAILRELKMRDDRDQRRSESPLTPAPDAYLLNTTKLAIEAAFDAALAYIDPIWQNQK